MNGRDFFICNKWQAKMDISSVQFISFQPLSYVRLFVTPWTAAFQAFLFITNSRSSLRLMSIESVMPSNHLILRHPLLLLPSIFPTSGSFLMSQFFASVGQSIGASVSASVIGAQTWITVVLNGLPWKWTKIIVVFKFAPNYFILDSGWLWGLLHFFYEILASSSRYNGHLN